MFTKITSRFLRQLDQSILQYRPAENIDTHGRQVASRIIRFLLKLSNPVIVICNDDTKTAGLLDRHLHSCNGYISIIRFVIFKHYLIIHLVDMVSGKNQYIFRVIILHIFKVLIDRICRTRIPVASLTFLVRRKNSNTSDIAVKIPRNTNSDMRVQTQRLVLC